MLGYFPDPYPDELFYSICARFAEAMHYPADTKVIIDLFGRLHSVTTEFPIGLDYLVASLPSGHCYTADYFIDEHTLLPFYGPFLPPERCFLLREAMHGDKGNAIGLHVGGSPGLVRPLSYLRLCAQCVIVDRERFGEAYWHRVHQIPGVLICPIHEKMLQDTHIAALSWDKERYRFFSTEEVLKEHPLADVSVQSPWQDILLAIAQDAAWLLKQHGLSLGIQTLRQHYQSLFFERGFISLKGHNKRLEALVALFRKKYSEELLKQLGCQLQNNRLGRLESFFEHMWRWRHPLYHLLLIYLLGSTAEAFCQFPAASPPFGEGPWPCLNKASDHYRQCIVEDCQITKSRADKNRLVGTFTCLCGFIYWRHGPDHEPEDQFRRVGIKAVGPIWEGKLHQLWEVGTLTQGEMAHQLGISLSHFRKHAMRLGLISYPAARPPAPSVEKLLCQSEDEASLCAEYRVTWIEALEAGLSIWAPDQTLRRVYLWLYKHDREWLQGHRPPHKPRESQEDKLSRDERLAKQIKAAALQLKNNSQRPVRITRLAIGRVMRRGKLASGWWKKKISPLAAQVLEEVVETTEAFRVRRVWWAASCYQREQICPERRQLCMRAGLNSISRASNAVEAAVDTALQMLAAGIDVTSGM